MTEGKRGGERPLGWSSGKTGSTGPLCGSLCSPHLPGVPRTAAEVQPLPQGGSRRLVPAGPGAAFLPCPGTRRGAVGACAWLSGSGVPGLVSRAPGLSASPQRRQVTVGARRDPPPPPWLEPAGVPLDSPRPGEVNPGAAAPVPVNPEVPRRRRAPANPTFAGG